MSLSSQKACQRKQAYAKKEAEERVILKYFQKGRGGYAYNCPHCGWWHITKMTKGEYAQTAQRR